MKIFYAKPKAHKASKAKRSSPGDTKWVVEAFEDHQNDDESPEDHCHDHEGQTSLH